MSGRVAVIGAGLAGLACARTLADHDVPVIVFDKSRGVGGRCATRSEGEWRFDHGAQYFTVRDPRLSPLVDRWQARGVIAPWDGRVMARSDGHWQPANAALRRWVGVPGMSALARHLATDLDVRLHTTVAHVHHERQQWRVISAPGEDAGVFDVVLAAMPAPQAGALLASVAPELGRRAAAAVMHPTWATMLVLRERPAVAWDGAFLNDDAVLSWVCRDASKPSRQGGETWVLHATRAWSVTHLEEDASSVARELTRAFDAVVGGIATPVHAVAHRWRYALPDPVADAEALYDADLGLGAAGDWCGGPRIEGAILSGMALADRVLTVMRAGTPRR